MEIVADETQLRKTIEKAFDLLNSRGVAKVVLGYRALVSRDCNKGGFIGNTENLLKFGVRD